MHDTALETARIFFRCYTGTRSGKILELGAQNINGSLRQVAPIHYEYIGADFCEGLDVDVVLKDPYHIPFEDNTFDIVVSSSCFEHSEFFWLLFNEMIRVTNRGGLCYINAPSNGSYHQFPKDCWRFYPDSGVAMQNWACRSGYDVLLLESFITFRKNSNWNDFVAVFLKGQDALSETQRRILDSDIRHYNAYRRSDKGVLVSSSYARKTEDQLLIDYWKGRATKSNV